MNIDELFGSLRTFEMTLDDKSEKKSKGISLQLTIKNDVSLVKNKESDEDLAESISLLAKQFGKALQRWDKRGGSQGNYVSPNVKDNNNPTIMSTQSSQDIFSGKKPEYEREIGRNQGSRDKFQMQRI